MIPFNGIARQYQSLRGEILEVTDSVLSTGKLMSGEYTEKFETWLATKNSTKFAVTCHSGTQALEIIATYTRLLCAVATPVAIIPSLTYIATATALKKAGWELQFADSGLDGIAQYNFERDVECLVSVGIYGLAAPSLIIPAQLYGLHIIEDGAQNWLCGPAFSSRAISFDPTKNLANYGNGGAIVTNNSRLYSFARHYRSNNSDSGLVATNSKMSEVDCAQLLVKTKYIDGWQKRRFDIASYWMHEFANSPVRTLITPENIYQHCYHKFVIATDHRDDLKMHLYLNNIETKIHYEKPLHEMEIFKDCKGPGFFSVASSLSRNVLSLPMHPELTDFEVEYIKNHVLGYFAKK